MTKEEEIRINATLATLQDAFNYMVNLRAASEARANTLELELAELKSKPKKKVKNETANT